MSKTNRTILCALALGSLVGSWNPSYAGETQSSSLAGGESATSSNMENTSAATHSSTNQSSTSNSSMNTTQNQTQASTQNRSEGSFDGRSIPTTIPVATRVPKPTASTTTTKTYAPRTTRVTSSVVRRHPLIQNWNRGKTTTYKTRHWQTQTWNHR